MYALGPQQCYSACSVIVAGLEFYKPRSVPCFISSLFSLFFTIITTTVYYHPTFHCYQPSWAKTTNPVCHGIHLLLHCNILTYPLLGTYRYNEAPVYTTSNGCPVMNPETSQRIGPNGPLLLQDFHLIDLLAHFDRERIPERVVHAKGAGGCASGCG